MENREQSVSQPNQNDETMVASTKIRQLDSHVIDKIAAGEVVERPASVLKELIENSIDAGANKIEIDIESGGLQSIVVRDDGFGIDREDIALALARHATSKLVDFDGLEHIQTLGFRGEALPSIASVSRLILTTRTKSDSHGWQVTNSGQESVGEPKPAQLTSGTVIEVQDLFHNTPARRKFLRSASTEFTHIRKLVRQMALSRMGIDFSLRHNGRKVDRYPAAVSDGSLKERLATVFDPHMAENNLRVEWEEGGIRASGWIGPPDYTRSQPDQQYLFVNGRSIRDRSLAHAVKQAYLDVLFDSSRFPIYALYLEFDPELVDVNVHPAKSEVRFRKPREFYGFVIRAIRGALLGDRPGTRKMARSALENIELPQAESSPSPQQEIMPLSLDNSWMQNAPKFSNVPKKPAQPIESETPSEGPLLGHALAQFGGAYVLAENKDGLVIVDMHAAHERINYEKLKTEYENSALQVQSLIVPFVIKVSAEEADVAMSHKEVLEGLGFDVSLASDTALSVRTMPRILKGCDIEKLIRDVISDLIEHGSSNRVEHVRNELLATVACHSSIRANDRLSVPEMDALLRQMEVTGLSGYCSHGRPTWNQITIKELDRLFYRGQ